MTADLMKNSEPDSKKILKSLKPTHNAGDFVFCVIDDLNHIDVNDVVLILRENEGYTVIAEKSVADSLKLAYTFVAAWITLTIHSSLDGVGLTAAFSSTLAENNISCNVAAGYYHDHIFVNKKDVNRTMMILNQFG